MSLRDEDPAAAECAWAEFYRRHMEYLYGVCQRAYRDLVGDLGVEDLVQDTFVRAFEKAHTFSSRGVTEPERLRRLVRAWLGKVASNLFRQGMLLSPKVDYTDEELQVASNVSDDPPAPDSPGVVLAQQALAALTEREQHVLRVTAHWYRPGQKHQRLPNRQMAELAKALKTTPTNVRQIRHRAMAKIAAYVKSHSRNYK